MARATPLSNTLFVIPDSGERRQLQYCQMSPPTSPKSAISLFSFLKKYFSVFVLLPIMSDVTFSVSPRLPFQPSTNQSLWSWNSKSVNKLATACLCHTNCVWRENKNEEWIFWENCVLSIIGSGGPQLHAGGNPIIAIWLVHHQAIKHVSCVMNINCPHFDKAVAGLLCLQRKLLRSFRFASLPFL